MAAQINDEIKNKLASLFARAASVDAKERPAICIKKPAPRQLTPEEEAERKEKMAEYQRKYYRELKDKDPVAYNKKNLERQKKWQNDEKNKDKKRAYNREWAARRREAIRIEKERLKALEEGGVVPT